MSELGKHLSNVYDPRREDAKTLHGYTFHAMDAGSQEEEWAWHMEWVNRNVIGPPKATETYTVDQLKERGYVGIYARDGGDE